MSDPLPILGTLLRSAGLSAPCEDQENSSSAPVAGTVFVRQHSPDGKFVRTIKCLPGRTTVLASHNPALIEPFRAALLGNEISEGVTMRFNTRVLHPSEVYAVENGYILWSKTSVADVLAGAGVPKSQQMELLEGIGLSYAHDTPPAELPPGALRRLLLICSFLSRSQVLYYDRPFAGIEERWLAPMAEILLRGTEICRRIVVLTNVDSFPPQWRTDPRVQIEELDYELKETVAKSEHEIRTLLSNYGPQEVAYFVTRPQVIHRKRRTVEVLLQAEAIYNPHIDTILNEKGAANEEEAEPQTSGVAQMQGGVSRASAGLAFDSAEAVRRPTPPYMRRSPSGKLTRVTGIKRIKYNPVVMGFREVKQKLSALFERDPSLSAMPKEARLFEQRRQLELRLFLYIVIGLALLLFVVHLRR